MTSLLLVLWLGCSARIDSERDALRVVELQRLTEGAQQALDQGELPEAAELIIGGERLDPAPFIELRAKLQAALSTAPPSVGARTHAVLYEGAHRPSARRLHRRLAIDLAAIARYRDPQRDQTRAEQVGVTRTRALAVLHTLRREYLEPLDDVILLNAASHRLAILVDAGPQAEIPPGDFDMSMEALWDTGRRLGLPEETVVAELTEAIFSEADQWSAPIWPAQIEAWQAHHSGVLTGVIGVQLGEELAILQLAEQGAAYKGGLHINDVLHKVNNTVILHAEQAANLLHGQTGSRVDIEVFRDGSPLHFTLQRGDLQEPTAFGYQRTDTGWSTQVRPGVIYLRLREFHPSTTAELTELLPAKAPSAVILDLRNNPGGDLDSALNVADLFVEKGPLLTVTRRDAEPSTDYRHATPGGIFEGVPTVVLVNQASASSAEVVAGALQYTGATIIGTPTAGKGRAQVLRYDQNLGVAVQFTNLAWSLPNGARLHRTDESARWGIVPDVEERLSPLEEFIAGVTTARRSALRRYPDGSPMPYTGPELDPELPPLSEDPALTRGLKSLGY